MSRIASFDQEALPVVEVKGNAPTSWTTGATFPVKTSSTFVTLKRYKWLRMGSGMSFQNWNVFDSGFWEIGSDCTRAHRQPN